MRRFACHDRPSSLCRLDARGLHEAEAVEAADKLQDLFAGQFVAGAPVHGGRQPNAGKGPAQRRTQKRRAAAKKGAVRKTLSDDFRDAFAALFGSLPRRRGQGADAVPEPLRRRCREM